jgi:hypothetical protein
VKRCPFLPAAVLLSAAACTGEMVTAPVLAPPPQRAAAGQKAAIVLAKLPASTAHELVWYVVDGVIYGEESFRALGVRPERITTIEVLRPGCTAADGRPVTAVLITLRRP